MSYQQKTDSIVVRVQPEYLEEQSSPDQELFVWAYHVEIENTGKQSIQLLNRHWKITDALGRTQEVRGAGVVGEQPVLKPGETYQYTSGTPLTTPSGIMLGTYEMAYEETSKDSPTVHVAIPAFSLDSPHEHGAVN